MCLFYTFVAAFLYTEIIVALLLLLPIGPYKWGYILKSQLLDKLGRKANLYFTLIMTSLMLCLSDTVREMLKYQTKEKTALVELSVGRQIRKRLSRAQTNFYISGIGIFLALIIRRLVTLILIEIGLLDQNEANIKKTQTATDKLICLMTDMAKEATKKDISRDTALNELIKLKERFQKLNADIELEKKDKDIGKLQNENVKGEYDRLSEEFSKLQKQIKQI